MSNHAEVFLLAVEKTSCAVRSASGSRILVNGRVRGDSARVGCRCGDFQDIATVVGGNVVYFRVVSTWPRARHLRSDK